MVSFSGDELLTLIFQVVLAALSITLMYFALRTGRSLAVYKINLGLLIVVLFGFAVLAPDDFSLNEWPAILAFMAVIVSLFAILVGRRRKRGSQRP